MKLRYLAFILLLLSLVSLFVGVKEIKPWDVFRLSPDQLEVLFISRLPRLIAILIAGISMGIAGLIMQQLSRNKFVSPTTGGTDDSARLGVMVALLLMPAAPSIQKMLVAFVFALAGTFVFMRILDKVKYKDTIFIPLVGLMFGNIVTAFTTFFAYKYDLVQSLSAWMQGNFALTIKGRYELLYVSVPVVILAYLYANRFTIAGMGEDFSVNLGLRYKQVVNIGLVIVALVSSAVMLTVGTIPFLGLIIPNIVTMYNGDHLKKNLPHTAVLGAVFVLFCDILGRVIIYPFEIPIGVTVGVLGSGIFLYLLLRRRAYDA
ncbi:ABC transporter permease [Paenibacillus thermoaerophilus]|uniref:ABC transporter permease n=1 Tax=Paenibacillus thermoaerophilus TaxID=1215385 RepID=A0ABW2V1I3_9BACL|nr:ABC transporter permease [Paenibacillus thermoaerophilus]TMV14314.1 ABC transporter permease [Paenibacillus thermoaerophilus]